MKTISKPQCAPFQNHHLNYCNHKDLWRIYIIYSEHYPHLPLFHCHNSIPLIGEFIKTVLFRIRPFLYNTHINQTKLITNQDKNWRQIVGNWTARRTLAPIYNVNTLQVVDSDTFSLPFQWEGK